MMLALVCPAFAAQWTHLGPDGGDARSLAYDPSNPDRLYLGTSAGELFVSNDDGANWARLAHLGQGFDYVLDNIVVDPVNSSILYVGAWSVEGNGGDVFKSKDRGQTWEVLSSMHGHSVRALAIAPSDDKIVIAGAIDGVFRSKDSGSSWQQISPASSQELKNFESIAIDPKSADVIYAGTWHLPWKTEDGGKNWKSIKQGVIDDSDVFSIIIDPKNPAVVYASACSGIYKSESAGALFHKIQGIPSTARRTRVLQQDPNVSATVYAGTTEGLWRTQDSGKLWTRISDANVIVNDVMIDPRDSSKIFLATDRRGVMASKDGGHSFLALNRGFAHRQVTSVVADKNDSSVLYASLINDREFGGVLSSHDGGNSWMQTNSGLDGRDVFSLEQSDQGSLVAGTNRGIFMRAKNSTEWRPINTALRERITMVPAPKAVKGKKSTAKPTMKREWLKSEITGRVVQVKLTPERWFAAGAQGLFRSLDHGASWTGGPVVGATNFIAIDAEGQSVLAATPNAAFASKDAGETWNKLQLPPYADRVFGVAVAPNNVIWITTQMGAFRSSNGGSTWEHVLAGQPGTNFSYVAYDRAAKRLVGVAKSRNQIFESRDGGDNWKLAADSRWPIRNVSVTGGRLLAVTDFDGVLAQPAPEADMRSQLSTGGGGGAQR